MDASTLDRVGRYAGPAAAVVSLGAVGLAMLVAPWFSPTANALSDLGAGGRRTAPLFNGGLLVGGLLGALFVARVARAESGPVARVGQLLLFGAMAALSAVGLFPTGGPTGLHGPVAVSFFVLLTYGLAVDGTATVLAGRVRTGLLFVWLSLAGVTGWIAFAAVAAAGTAPGIALPELVGSVALAVWAVRKAQTLDAR